jgi:hypothetical protein
MLKQQNLTADIIIDKTPYLPNSKQEFGTPIERIDQYALI